MHIEPEKNNPRNEPHAEPRRSADNAIDDPISEGTNSGTGGPSETTTGHPNLSIGVGTSPWKRVSLLSQIALTTFGAIGVIIYGCQLRTMNSQLDQMRGSARQTDKLLGLYQDQLKQLANEAADAGLLASAASKQADASLRSADAQETADAMLRDQFALSERPWIQVNTDVDVYQSPLWVGNNLATGEHIVKQPADLMSVRDQLIVARDTVALTIKESLHKSGFEGAGL